MRESHLGAVLNGRESQTQPQRIDHSIAKPGEWQQVLEDQHIRLPALPLATWQIPGYNCICSWFGDCGCLRFVADFTIAMLSRLRRASLSDSCVVPAGLAHSRRITVAGPAAWLSAFSSGIECHLYIIAVLWP
jgi:hypothetical protein